MGSRVNTAENLWLTRQGNDLRMRWFRGGGQITVEDHFAGETTRFETFRIHGTDVTAAAINTLVCAMAAFTEPDNGLDNLAAAARAAVVAARREAGNNWPEPGSLLPGASFSTLPGF